MESMSSSVSSFAFLVLVTFLSCLWLIFHFKTRSTPRGALPPGNLWLIPLVGETLQLLKAYRTENPEPFIDQRVRKHGSVFTTHIFGEKTVFLADPIANKAVLHNKGGQFECSYPTSIAELLGKHSLLITTGPSHKRLHSLTLTAFSSTANLRDDLLPNIDRLVRLNLNSWENNTVIRLHEKTKKITFDLAVKQLLSFDPGEWSETLRKEFVLVLDGFFSIPIRVFTLTAYARAVVARRKVAEALREVVRERKEEEKKDKVGCIDMLGRLLEEGDDEEMVVDFLVGLLVAGYETTSTIMTLAIKYLTHNCSPNAIALLKEEHEAIRARKEGDADPLNWNDYKHHMPFTHCVINETLRMANIISGVFRRAMTDVQINGYTIPKGCKLFTSFRGVHLDTNHYDDARTFNPWRWQQNEQQPQHEQQNHGSNNGSKAPAFTPFGGGQRLCPGYELAKLEICVFLHYFLTYFSWEEEGEDKVIFFPTTRTVKGYPIRISRRRGSL